MSDLPSVEECRAFFDALNDERERLDLKPLASGELDFDGSQPGSTENCLSARNCYVAADPYGWVGHRNVWVRGGYADIPDAIRRVTNAFDRGEDLAALRARLVEAGVV